MVIIGQRQKTKKSSRRLRIVGNIFPRWDAKKFEKVKSNDDTEEESQEGLLKSARNPHQARMSESNAPVVDTSRDPMEERDQGENESREHDAQQRSYMPNIEIMKHEVSAKATRVMSGEKDTISSDTFKVEGVSTKSPQDQSAATSTTASDVPARQHKMRLLRRKMKIARSLKRWLQSKSFAKKKAQERATEVSRSLPKETKGDDLERVKEEQEVPPSANKEETVVNEKEETLKSAANSVESVEETKESVSTIDVADDEAKEAMLKEESQQQEAVDSVADAILAKEENASNEVKEVDNCGHLKDKAEEAESVFSMSTNPYEESLADKTTFSVEESLADRTVITVVVGDVNCDEEPREEPEKAEESALDELVRMVREKYACGVDAEEPQEVRKTYGTKAEAHEISKNAPVSGENEAPDSAFDELVRMVHENYACGVEKEDPVGLAENSVRGRTRKQRDPPGQNKTIDERPTRKERSIKKKSRKSASDSRRKSRQIRSIDEEEEDLGGCVADYDDLLHSLLGMTGLIDECSEMEQKSCHDDDDDDDPEMMDYDWNEFFSKF